jgi:glycosyltransferase involved in cell wall biosynthesis
MTREEEVIPAEPRTSAGDRVGRTELQLPLRIEPPLRGDGAQRQGYETELTKLGIRRHVTMTGLVPSGRIPRLLSCIDLLAHTSQWEGLPRACVQALLMEKPVVSFDIDGAPEVVISGSTGMLIALNDQAGFADAIIEMAGRPTIREGFGREGRKLCLSEFDHREMMHVGGQRPTLIGPK